MAEEGKKRILLLLLSAALGKSIFLPFSNSGDGDDLRLPRSARFGSAARVRSESLGPDINPLSRFYSIYF